MTVRISPHKASRILQHFFKGLPQPEIAEKCGVNQATVSRYALKFKMDARESGIIATAKEYGIMNEVDSLRSLSVELSNNRLTVEEAKQGLGILKHFNSLGVTPDRHGILVKVIAKLEEPGFIESAMKLINLESSTGRVYTDIVSQFEHLSEEVPGLEVKSASLKRDIKKAENTTNQLTIEEKNNRESIRKLDDELQRKRSAIEVDLDKKMKQANLTLERIKRLEPIAETLKAMGITDEKLGAYLKEHQILEAAGLNMDTLKKMMAAAE